MANFQILDDEQIRRVAPSVFATEPWEGVSERYAFIPTIDVVNGLRNEGFFPVRAQQSKSRIPGKAEFTKHLLRFRHHSALQNLNVGDEIPEIVLVNSHDRTSAYQIDAGIFRLACTNGLVVKSSDFGSFKVQHAGDIVGRVIEGSYSVIEEVPQIIERVSELKSIELNENQQRAFATAALALRYDTDESGVIKSPVSAEQLLQTRRFDDRKNDLWTTYNRVQENLLKGGLRGRSENGRRIRTRTVNSVTEDIRLNKSLWVLTEELAKVIH